MVTWQSVMPVLRQDEKKRRQFKASQIGWPKAGDEVPDCMIELLTAKMLTSTDRLGHFRELSGDLPCGLRLTEALDMRWQEIPVPLYDTRTGTAELAWLLIGLLPEGAPRSHRSHRSHRCSFGSMAQDARQAVENALNLVSGESGRFFALMPRHADHAFRGASLGLPVWLGAKALLDDLPDDVLATGELDASGALLPVQGIEQKAGLLPHSGRKKFFYPADNAVPPLDAFPLLSKEDALFLLRHLLKDADFWDRLARIRADSRYFWKRLPLLRDEKPESVEFALSYAQECKVPQCGIPPESDKELGQACDLMEKRRGVDFFSPMFGMDWAGEQARSVNLFRLCQIQLTRANHRGRSDEAAAWERLAEQCRKEVENSGRGAREYFLGFDARKAGVYHNLFHFVLPQDLRQRVLRSLEHFRDYTSNEAGKACGTLCQNAAYRLDFHEALDYADRSEQAFGLNEEGRGEALRRARDRAYIFWDMGEKEKARENAERFIRECGPNDKPFACALQARMAAEGERVSLEEGFALWERLGQPSRHPWQLFFFNAGQALGDADCLRRSFEICCRNEGTIRIMGLLPLAFLHEDASAWAEKEGDALREYICNSDPDLNRDHFRPLLEAPDMTTAFETLRSDLRCFFPFDYR